MVKAIRTRKQPSKKPTKAKATKAKTTAKYNAKKSPDVLDELTLEIDRESEALVSGMIDDLGQGLNSQLTLIIQPLMSTLEDVSAQLERQSGTEAQPAFNEFKRSVQRGLEDLNESLEDVMSEINALKGEAAKQGETLKQVLNTLESIDQRQQEILSQDHNSDTEEK